MSAAEPGSPSPEDQPWVTVATLEDPLEAELLEELFREAAIPVAMPGTQHRAMLGVLGGYVHIPVQVPEGCAREALQLLDAYRLSRSDPAAHGVPDPEPSQREAAARVERSARSAIGVSLLGAGILVSVGAGHAYVRQYPAAAALFALGWTAVVALFQGIETWPALFLLVLVDALGAAYYANQTRSAAAGAPYHAAKITVLALLVLSLSPMLARFLSAHAESASQPPALLPPLQESWDGRQR